MIQTMSLVDVYKSIDLQVASLQPTLLQRIRSIPIMVGDKKDTLIALASYVLLLKNFNLQNIQSSFPALETQVTLCNAKPDTDTFNPNEIKKLWKLVKRDIKAFREADAKVKKAAASITKKEQPVKSIFTSDKGLAFQQLPSPSSKGTTELAQDEYEPGSPKAAIGKEGVPHQPIAISEEEEKRSYAERRQKIESVLPEITLHMNELIAFNLRDSMVIDVNPNKRHAEFIYEELNPIFKDDKSWFDFLSALHTCKDYGFIRANQIEVIKVRVADLKLEYSK